MNVVQTVLTYTVFLPMLFGCGGGDVFTDTVALATTKNITNANRILQRIDGVWSAMGTGLDGNAVALTVEPSSGTVYAGGYFNSAGGDGDCNKIAKWDGATWSPLGVGFNDFVSTIAVAPNGDVFAGGVFNDEFDIIGTRLVFIARWDGTAWNAVGAGLNGHVYELTFDSNGLLIIVGAFTDEVGGPGGTYNRICTWDGTSFAALGTGANDIIKTVCIDSRNNYYVGGQFTQLGGASANRIGYWDGSAWQTMGSGTASPVDVIRCGPTDQIYVSGDFTSISGVDVNYIARNAGAQGGAETWVSMGDGLTAAAVTLWPLDAIRILSGGVRDRRVDPSVRERILLWDGTYWNIQDIDFPGTPNILELAQHANKLFVTFGSAGTASTSGMQVTTVNHAGSTRAFPTITITRSGGTTAVLESIQNLTTGKVLLFDHPMLDGERIVIDLTPGHKTITTYVGDSTNNALNDCLPGSDFGTFALAPGDNDIALYISETGSPTLTAFIQWQTTYPTIDGAP